MPPLDGTTYVSPVEVTETKPDVFSIEGLIAWLEKQPADAGYCWGHSGRCLFSRYGEHLGLGNGEAAYFSAIKGFRAAGAERFGEPFGGVAHSRPHTFGAALSRARTYHQLEQAARAHLSNGGR